MKPHQQNKEPEFTIAEITKGEAAFCLRQGEDLHIIREHMTPGEAVQMFIDVMSGRISQDDLVNNYQWRTISIQEAGFTGMDRIQLPPVNQWPNKE